MALAGVERMRKIWVRQACNVALIVASSWALAVGCAGEAKQEGAGEADAGVAAPVAPSEARQRAEALLRGGALEQALCERGLRAARAEAIAAALKGWSGKKVAAGGLRQGELLGRAYGEGARWVFVSGASLSARGEAVVGALRGASGHGMDPAGLGVAGIEAEVAAERGQGAQCGGEGGVKWRPVAPDVEAVSALVAGAKGADEAAWAAHVAGALLAPGAPAGEQVRGWAKEAGASLEGLARLELRVADGFLQYAREMKLGNIAAVGWKDVRAAGGSRKLVAARQEALMGQLLAASDEEAAALVSGLAPGNPQYKALVEARVRYKAAVDAGGWEKVEGVSVAAGTRGAGVKRLWRRLAAEGYLEGESEVADGRLRNAVRRYKETHQLSGELGAAFWRSLNMSATKRLEQIDRTLARLREGSRHEGEQTFIYVNLPSFAGELWHEGALKHKFPVVIGKANKVCNEKTKRWEMPNATPQLESELEYFVLNPVWYVPERIVEEEIKPKAEKDESWLAANHYEVVSKKKDKWEVLQTSGPWNALGLVKFIFPNPHNTYMHDTSHREYFSRTVRAYSHGCMRVEDPLKLAKLLVEVDGQPLDVDAVVAGGRSKKVEMQKKIPVFVEYYTVHVDEDKMVNFLIDIYDLEDPPSKSPPADCTTSRGSRPAKVGPASRGDIGP